MDQHEAVIEPETETEQALAVAAERVVAALSKPSEMTEQSKFNIHELLVLYDFGIGKVKKRLQARWRLCFSLAVSAGGVWAVMADDKIGYLGIFWRTNNINVNIRKEVPHPEPDGLYVYVAFHWNETKAALPFRFRSHMVRACPGARFIGGHDFRVGHGRRPMGTPFVIPIPKSRIDAVKVRN